MIIAIVKAYVKEFFDNAEAKGTVSLDDVTKFIRVY